MTEQEFEQALLDPQAKFGTPESVLGREDLSAPQKRQLLEQWEADARRLSESAEEGMTGGESAPLDRISDALRSLGAG